MTVILSAWKNPQEIKFMNKQNKEEPKYLRSPSAATRLLGKWNKIFPEAPWM